MTQPQHSMPDAGHDSSMSGHTHGKYGRFLLMILASAVVMYAVMYLNTYAWDHVYWSWTRFYITLMSAATMAVIMLLFMQKMYTDRAKNTMIYLGSLLLFVVGLWLVRSQALVGDVAWMKAMIPHHSIALLTSERAQIKGPRVRKLADGIIETQKREIAEMKGYIQDLQK